MESKTKIFGHAAHQIAVVFPLGLLSTSLIFDLAYKAAKKPQFSQTAFWMLVSGLAGGALAAPLGWNDWRYIPEGTRAKSIGRWHGYGNAIVLALFGGSALLRRGETRAPSGAALTLSLLGGGLAMAAGWLGGELVDRMRVGIDDGAHLNSPSSLSGLPAGDAPDDGNV
ncbi:MAG: DUF2231 domain-containing protein [Armatimonadota bacterium]|nr:DUF2231 domain-containing protein [Armatimonadota bacterium]